MYLFVFSELNRSRKSGFVHFFFSVSFFFFFAKTTKNKTQNKKQMASTRRTLLLSLPLLLFVNLILAEDRLISIDTPNDLIWLSNAVNSGHNFFQMTVVLTDDLDMSELSSSFKPIGLDSERPFSGTFFGQGYSISNLNISSKGNDYAGLFGVSRGMVLKNLVLKDSCNTVGANIAKNTLSFLGSFVGSCISKSGHCVLHDLVNLGTLIGSDYKYVGGIAGFIGSGSSSDFRSYVIDCINLGNSWIDGEVPEIIFGGIVGGTVSTKNSVYIQNCANYGYLIQYSSNFMLVGGGIVGSIADNTNIQNCFNTENVKVGSRYVVGSIAGKVDNIHDLKSEIKNCYWLKGVYDNKAVGRIEADYGSCVKDSSSFSKDLNLVTPVNVYGKRKTKIIDALNSFSDDLFKWIVLDQNCSSENSIKVILRQGLDLPMIPSKEGYAFRGWYSDPYFKSKPTIYPGVAEANTDTFCAKWTPNIKVTFIFASGAERIEKKYNGDEIIGYPDIKADYGHKGKWCTKGGRKICNPETSDEDIELYFVQTPKDYRLFFDTNGGEKIWSRMVTFGTSIGELPVPEKEGCEFLGWYTDLRLRYPYHPMKMPGYDMCLYAKWKSTLEVERGIALFVATVFVAAGVALTWIVFGKRNIIGLKL